MTNVLKAVRINKGLPIAAVAVRARVGTATITMIEKYGHEPRPDTKARIATALAVSVEAIWPTADCKDER